ncbi:competence protein ComK [Virgibacillus tibetensis]|uniref:competence protein ComK n=1 Tax=Virgibacillus tibetensis TaxID=3042313 RepID=UPI002E175C09
MITDLYSPSHEITPLTMAIVAQRGLDGTTSTCVLEEQEEYVIRSSPSKIMDHACKFFGASLKGRQEGTRDICGITHKAPISVDPSSGMYFFPTSSPKNSKCSWIAHSHIDKVNKGANHRTEIVFKNGKSILVESSYGSILNQIQRTAQYRYLLDNRIRFLQKHSVAELAPEPFA